MEIWKQIKGYEELYEVSNLGNVRSKDKTIIQDAKNNSKSTHLYKGKTLKPMLQNNGYYTVTLCYNQKYKIVGVHRLVAQAFIPNPDNKPQVNHIDGNKMNNCVDNLEYCTAKENMQHAFKNNLINLNTEKRKEAVKLAISKAIKSNCKKVVRINTNTNERKIYKKIDTAFRENKMSPNTLRKCLQKEIKEYKGYRWEYANER